MASLDKIRIIDGQTSTDYDLNGGSSENYSTEEQVIGTWINGKPLYQKTIMLDSLQAGDKKYAHGISNLEIGMVDLAGSYCKPYTNNTECYALCAVFSAGTHAQINDFSICVNWVDSTDIAIEIGSSRIQTGSVLYVTIRYTKTTDTVNQ